MTDVLLPEKWRKKMLTLDIAFQPIVHPKSGHAFAMEALLRGYRESGFSSIDDVFDQAFKDGVLFDLDLALQKKVYEKFIRLPFYSKVKLFYNFDHRAMEMKNYDYKGGDDILVEYGLDYSAICLEISEKFRNTPEVLSLIHQQARRLGFKIAIDDFGAIFAGYELLYYTEPHFIKLDRFLIAGMDKDNKKKSFCAHIVSLAHLLGISVIAEGIETEGEFYASREIDADLLQGYFIQTPAVDVDELTYSYTKINRLYKKNRRQPNADAKLIAQKTLPVDGIYLYADTTQIRNILLKWKNQDYFALLDNNHFPIGYLEKADIEDAVRLYPTMPQALQRSHSLRMLSKKCPILDINLSLDKIIEIFVSNNQAPGVIIISNLKYFGFLDSKALLEIINNKNLIKIHETNSLTALPGNSSVSEYIQQSLIENNRSYYFVTIDFENFKHFNNRFGFRQGDRLIALFAEYLKKEFPYRQVFIGHLGGDDFFIGIEQKEITILELRTKIKNLITEFGDAVATFYSKEEFLQGYYYSKDRQGNERLFPLLNAKASILLVPNGREGETFDNILELLNSMKEKARHSSEGISVLTLKQNEIENAEVL